MRSKIFSSQHERAVFERSNGSVNDMKEHTEMEFVKYWTSRSEFQGGSYLQCIIASIQLGHFWKTYDCDIPRLVKHRPFAPKLHSFHSFKSKKSFVFSSHKKAATTVRFRKYLLKIAVIPQKSEKQFAQCLCIIRMIWLDFIIHINRLNTVDSLHFRMDFIDSIFCVSTLNAFRAIKNTYVKFIRIEGM